MKSYFFVPAVLPKITKSKTISPDEIILDFEDGLGRKLKPLRFAEIDSHFENKVWIRLEKSQIIDLNLADFSCLSCKGFVIPKANSIDELYELCDKVAPFDLILLIEHPNVLLKLSEIWGKIDKNRIKGICLGSHDYSNKLGIRYKFKFFNFQRDWLVNTCADLDADLIDVVSMETKKKDEFIIEVDDGVSRGYTAKALVHPLQLEWMNQWNSKQQEGERVLAKKIIAAFERDNTEAPRIIDGAIFEAPHLKWAKKFLEKK